MPQESVSLRCRFGLHMMRPIPSTNLYSVRTTLVHDATGALVEQKTVVVTEADAQCLRCKAYGRFTPGASSSLSEVFGRQWSDKEPEAAQA